MAITGEGFVPGAPVQISIGGRALATATGPTFTVNATVPNMAGGRVYVEARADEGQAAAPFLVEGSASAPGDNNGSSPGSDSRSPAIGGRPGNSSAGPGSTSGTTAGGNATGGGRTSGTVSGGERSRGVGSSGAAGADVGLATAGSGQSVFADSVGAGAQAARRGAASKSAPSERSASGDLWSGFGSGKNGAGAGFAEATVPASGPGSALNLAMALGGLGLVALLTGAGVTGVRRRRALAGKSEGHRRSSG